MPPHESHRLAAFSQSVRQATIGKLRSVPYGKENWRPTPQSLSFADYAQYLLDQDQCFFKTIKTKESFYCLPQPGLKTVKDHKEFEHLIDQLAESQKTRWRMLKDFPDELMDELPTDPSFVKITTWWSILRGNLENELDLRKEIVDSLRKATEA